MKKYLRDYLFLGLLAGVIIALDQITKNYVISTLQPQDFFFPVPWLAPYVRIVYWYNTGVAFGLFQGQTVIFTLLNSAIALAIIYYFPRVPAREWIIRIALGMQLAGAVGNLIDRVRLGHVVDFISIGNFPVFNVADSSITVGVAILVLGVMIQEQREKKAAALAAQAQVEAPAEPVSLPDSDPAAEEAPVTDPENHS